MTDLSIVYCKKNPTPHFCDVRFPKLNAIGVPASDLFNDNENTICLEDRSEVWIIKNYRRLSERQKGRIEGYIKALLDQTGRNDFQSE